MPEERPIAHPPSGPSAWLGEEPEFVERVPLGLRLAAAVRSGAWTGAVFGFVAFLVATTGWAANPMVSDNGGPAIVSQAIHVIVGFGLASVVFGSSVAGISPAITEWANPGMKLTKSPISTTLLGGILGLLLGAANGALLAFGVGDPVEGSEGVVRLAILPTLLLMLAGGAVLGAVTVGAALLVGVSAAVHETAEKQVARMRGRLKTAISVPIAAVMLLFSLVLPFAWGLIRANHFTPGFAAVVAIITAGGILGFATLPGSRPSIRVSLGELMIVVVSLATVIGIIVVVLAVRGPAEPEATGPGGFVEILAGNDLSFDATAWTVTEGTVTFVYANEGDIVHTLVIEDREEVALRVEKAGDVDEGEVNLAPGEYTIFCDIRGHREAGMEGVLTVTPA